MKAVARFERIDFPFGRSSVGNVLSNSVTHYRGTGKGPVNQCGKLDPCLGGRSCRSHRSHGEVGKIFRVNMCVCTKWEVRSAGLQGERVGAEDKRMEENQENCAIYPLPVMGCLSVSGGLWHYKGQESWVLWGPTVCGSCGLGMDSVRYADEPKKVGAEKRSLDSASACGAGRSRFCCQVDPRSWGAVEGRGRVLRGEGVLRQSQ